MTYWNLESLPIAYQGDPATSASPLHDEAATGFQQQLDEARRRPEPRDEAAARDDVERRSHTSSDDSDAAPLSDHYKPNSVAAEAVVEPTPAATAKELDNAEQSSPTSQLETKTSPSEAGEAKPAAEKGQRSAAPASSADVAYKNRASRLAKTGLHGKQPVVDAEQRAVDASTTGKPAAAGEAAAANKTATETPSLVATPVTAPVATKVTEVEGAADSKQPKDAKARSSVTDMTGQIVAHKSEGIARDSGSKPTASANDNPESADKAIFAASSTTVSSTSGVTAVGRTTSVDAKSPGKRTNVGVEAVERTAAPAEVKPSKQEAVAVPVVEGVLDRPPSLPSATPDDAPNGENRTSGEFCRPLPPPPEGAAGGGLKPPVIQLGPRGVDESSGAVNVSAVDRARFLQRVSRAIHSAVDGGGQMKLRLSPPELGSLKLEVTLRDGALSARFEAETPQARTLLIESAPALRERLSEQNITLERYEVDLMQQPSEQKDQFTRPGRDDRETRLDENQRRTNKPAAAANDATPRRPASLGADGRLNVVI